MTASWDKYAAGADTWSDEAYADSTTYLARRADVFRSLGPALRPGDAVVDLACGDGGFGDFLPEYRYLGVDASAEMVASAQAQRRNVVQGNLNDYEPPEPVSATSCFRAIYYADDREAFFRRAADYTEKKLVFDLNPRQYRVDEVRGQLRAAGFEQLELRPFFSPQRVSLPGPAARALHALERSGPLARLALRFRFSYLCAAFRGGR